VHCSHLIQDGKVCLSLLGTWSGPGWVSGKSTLLQVCVTSAVLRICAHTLQVLISIQSMILCEEPYLNEPGWGNDGGTPQSRQCEWLNATTTFFLIVWLDSANVRRMVVKTAVRSMHCSSICFLSFGVRRCSGTSRTLQSPLAT
jgi:hypothetical protein